MEFDSDDKVKEFWRGVRAAQGAGLENRCGVLRHRGFESHPLRFMLKMLLGSGVQQFLE